MLSQTWRLLEYERRAVIQLRISILSDEPTLDKLHLHINIVSSHSFNSYRGSSVVFKHYPRGQVSHSDESIFVTFAYFRLDQLNKEILYVEINKLDSCWF